VRLRVDLEDNRFSSHILRRPRDLWRSCAARAAPRRPEVDKHGNCGAVHDFIEENRIRGQRFCDRSKRGLARAASARVGQMPGSDTVLLVALRTGSDDWQDDPLLLNFSTIGCNIDTYFFTQVPQKVCWTRSSGRAGVAYRSRPGLSS
jgi:hypothetical protein